MDEKTSEITMRVIPENVENRHQAEFTLVNMPAGTKVSGEHITDADVSEDGEIKVTVSNTTLPGDYKFTLTSDGKEKDVTLHVLNATMGGAFKIEKLYETSDMNQLVEEVKTALQNEEVYYSEPVDNVESSDVDAEASYSFNINKLAKTKVEEETARHFVVKVRLEEDYTFYNGDELVAVNHETGEKYITQQSKTDNHSYFVYLDAEELSRDIAIANKNSTEAQITSEDYDETVTVKVDPTDDAILRTKNDADGKPEISKLNNVSDDKATNNQKGINTNDVRAKVSLDENRFNTIDLYVKSDLLQEYSLGEGLEKYGTHRWIGIDFQILVGSDYNTKDDKVTVSANGGAYAGIVDSEKLNVTSRKNKKIVAWLPGEFNKDEYKRTYTVHVEYFDEDTEEETDVTINVYNAGYVYLKSVEAGNEATAKILERNITCETPHIGEKNKNVYMQKIHVNVKKNGIIPTKYNPKTGKYDETDHLWVYLKLSYNVPYDWVVWNGAYDGDAEPSGKGTHGSGNQHEDINTDGIHDDYSEYVWFDLNTENWVSTLTNEENKNAVYVTERAICNVNGRYEVNGFNADMATNVRLVFDDYSDTATMYNHLEGASWTEGRINIDNIKGVDIKDKDSEEVQAEIRKAINSTFTDGETEVTASTWKELLENALKTENQQSKISTLNGTYGKLTINGTEGRWMLAFLSVRNAEKITTDNKAFILDWEDSAVIGGTLYKDGDLENADKAEIPYGKFNQVPVWINLDSEDILKTNLKVDDKENEYGFVTLKINSDYNGDGENEETKEMNIIIKVEEEKE